MENVFKRVFSGDNDLRDVFYWLMTTDQLWKGYGVSDGNHCQTFAKECFNNFRRRPMNDFSEDYLIDQMY